MPESSACSAAVRGAGRSSESFSNISLRATSSGSLSLLKRTAAAESSVVAAFSSRSVSAAIISVSSVMKFCCTQEVRLALMVKSSRRFSAGSTNDRDAGAIYIVVRDHADGILVGGARQDLALAQRGADFPGDAARAAHVEDDDVGLHLFRVDPNAWNLRESFGEIS